MKKPSIYIRHLPELYQSMDPDNSGPFLGQFLKIFEALLDGRSDAIVRGIPVKSLDNRIDGFEDYLDPAKIPIEDADSDVLISAFLSYLSSWVALTLDQSWDMSKKRLWLSRIVALYKRRGTLNGIREYLKVFVGNQVTVDEPPDGFVIAETSTVGGNTFISGAPAYFFRVRIAYAFGGLPFDINEWKNLRKGSRAIVDLEKPAHTYYTLDARTPGFIIASNSTVGNDTLIWERSQIFV